MTQQECNVDKILKFLSELQTQLNEITPSKKATFNKNEQTSEKIEEKRSSWWVRIRERVKKIGKEKKKASYQASDSGGSQGGSRRFMRNIDEEQEDADLAIRKLQSDILQMITAFRNLTEFQTNMSKSLELDLRSTKLRAILKKTDSIKPRSHDLKEIRRKVFTLKCQIPSLLHKQSSRGISITDSQTAEENDVINETGSDIYLPGLHVSEDLINSLAFEEVVEKFQSLSFAQKLCLLSFAVFPENREVERTMLMYWWIGEGFISCDDSEYSVTNILDEFLKKRLLEPVDDERKLIPSSYRMEPHVHSAVIYLAKYVNLFELYSPKGKLIMKKSLKQKVCLVKGSSLLKEAKASAMKPQTLQTIFNSSERYPDFTFKWFPLMNSLRVLYLGRWERTAKRHIEVESTEFLKNMRTLKNLRLASFQGISRIEKLENSICALPELVILDLKACYNLEVLPSDIGLFEKLVYLDVSECYMLDRMPKGIAKLSRLQVLKGFVISESDQENNCAVKHLVNLRKLSITVNKYSFKVESLMESLTGLERLESLKIAWGASFREDDHRGEKTEKTNEADESRETTNEEKENQGGPATEKKLKDLMEQDDDQAQRKGQTSKEKKGDIEETGKREDEVSSKKGDGRNEETNLEEEKKHDETEAESLKSDKVVEEEKKTSPSSQEATETIQNKPDNQEGKNKMEEEGDANKGKDDIEEGNKQDEAKKSKSEVVEGEMKGSPPPPQESSDMIQKKPDDESKVEKERDGDKGKADQDEGKKQDEVEATKSKSDKAVEGDHDKTSPPQESKDTIQNKTDDKTKVEKEGDGDKEKADPKEGTKHDEVEAGISKSDNGVEGVKKPSPSRDDQKDNSKVQEKGDGNKESVDLDEEKKKNEVKAMKSRDEKTSPPQESKDTIQNKTDDKTKVEKERDGDKGKADPKEGTKHDEVEAGISKSDNGVEGVKKPSPSRDDQKDNNKLQEKGDGNKESVDLDEEKKKNEVKAESSNPPQESKDTIQSKADDDREISKAEEKGDGDDIKKLDGGEAKTQKSHKTIKFGKKVGFSEKSDALIQKKLDDLSKDNAMAEEIHETASPSRKSRSSKTKLFMALGNKTKNWGIGWQENQAIDDTSKLPSSLKKLELECFPKENPPTWLNPKDLHNLKKLSIKGGKLSRISDELPTADNKWPVEILRLKYLHEFKVEWRDLQKLFPNMTLLEKYKCPKIAFCPTDGNGVWRSQPQTSPNMRR